MCLAWILLFLPALAFSATGDVISSFPSPSAGPFGLAWDGTHLWNGDDNTALVYRLTTTGAVDTSFPAPCTFTKGMTLEGPSLWVTCDGSSLIYELTATGVPISTIPAPGGVVRGCTWDGANLWVADAGTDRVYQVTTSGTVLSSFAAPGSDPRGLAFDGTHLWLADNSTDRIYQLSTGGVTLSSFAAPGASPRGLTFDGTDLWHADNGTARIYQLQGPTGDAVSGRVFEDVNYGGGAGRNWMTASGNGGAARPNARVELFDNTGAFVDSTTTDASGNYAFVGLLAGSYTVRVVSSSVTSARTDYVAGLIPIQTFRTDAATGTALDVTDHVGGHDPAMADAGNAATGWILNASTGAFSGSGSGKAHAFAPVTVAAASVSGVDFGWNFDTIVNTNNSGQGSLRQCFIHANTLGGDASLAQAGRPAGIESGLFMISNGTSGAGLRAANNYFLAGVATIAPTTGLPAVSGAMVLDASTQPGFVGTPVVRIDGASAGPGTDGLALAGTGDGSTIRGLMVTRFSRDGIAVQSGADNITIAGNWIGTIGTGSVGVGNGDDGIDLAGASALIGGTGAADRNVITNNGDEGITSVGAGVTGHVIQGNYIGVDPDGSSGGGNVDVGVAIITGTGNRIGGTGVAARNVISRNFEGIEISSSNNEVQGNFIGTDASGTLNRGNRSDDGVEIQGSATGNRIGGAAAGAGNRIAFNARNGVNVVNGSGNAVLGNEIYLNTWLGINLGAEGVTVNDAGDGDTGANSLQNFPVLTSAVSSGGNTTIIGTLNSTANTPFRVEFVSNPAGDGSGYGEGQVSIGFAFDTTDGSGNATINTTLIGVSVTAGHAVSATGTVDLGGGGYGSTSEFAQNVVAVSGAAGITVMPTSGLTTTEAGGTAGFTVVLDTQPTADVTIGLSSNDLSEGTVAPASVTLTPANWDTAQTVTVTGVDDAIQDGDVGYTIVTAAAASADPGYAGLDAVDVSVTNTDDDVVGITVDPVAGLVTTEAGGAAAFTVVLNTIPTADVIIGLSSSDSTEGIMAPVNLTFSAPNWNVPQVVTVSGVNDLLVDGDIAYAIETAPAVSSDPVYAGLDAADIGVTNTDNDTGPAVELQLTASRERVEIGEPVRFSLIVRNLTASTLTPFSILHDLPPRFAFLKGTATRDGRAIADPVAGGPQVFPVASLAPFVDTNGNGRPDPGEPGQTTLSWQLVPGAGAIPGTYVDAAIAVEGCASCVVSNRATDDVRVEESSLLARGTIIGRVFEDLNRNGYQDRDDRGLPSVSVAMDDGTRVTTDSEGRFHVPEVESGPHVLKIDLGQFSLPATPTTDATAVVDVAGGLLTPVRFGLSFSRDTVRTGKPAVRGLALITEAPEQTIDVVGNALQHSLVVNGQAVTIRTADARLAGREFGEILRVTNSRLERPADFHLDVDDRARVVSWRLMIEDSGDSLVRAIDGQGSPPENLQWDGRLDDGGCVTAGSVYGYRLRVDYVDATVLRGARRTFGVERHTSVAMTMTGDAFETGRAELSREAQEALSTLARDIRRAEGETIVVEGHTDAVGDATGNMELSRRRAEAAVRFLVERERIPRSRLVVKAFGETQPVAGNGTPEGRELNRRIEIHGAATEIERARLYDIYRAQPLARIGNQDAPVDSLGRFAWRHVTGEDTVSVSMTDRRGRTSSARIQLPRLDLVQPAGEVRLPFGARTDAARVSAANGAEGALEPLASLDGGGDPGTVAHVWLRGRTDPGTHVSVDGEPLDVANDGRFEKELPLHVGENTFGVVARSTSGAMRVTNLTVRANENGEDGRGIVVVERIPNLTVYLPPEGATLTTRELAVAGHTEPGYRVIANGDTLGTAADGSFAGRVMLPEGSSRLALEVVGEDGRRGQIERQFTVQSKRLFLVALADGVVGGTNGGPGEDRSTWTEGRLAYQLKGWIAGRVLVNSAFDSRRREWRSLFRDLDDAGRDRLLVNLDPDRLYPVFGDSGSIAYENQGAGRFYLALEADQARAAIGNFPIALDQVELAAFHRTLYGAQLRLGGAAAPGGGSQGTGLQIFAAEARHTHVRDVIRATGGTLYYLSHADIIEGSTQVDLVVYDRDTGLPLTRQRQQPGMDYVVKEFEGRLQFTRPIASVWDDGSIVDADRLHGHPVVLEVDYESRGALAERSAVGGRMSHTLGVLQLGGTMVQDDTGPSSYRLRGGDVKLHLGSRGKLSAELAESEGRSARTFTSFDGGLAFSGSDTGAVRRGQAWKIAGEVDPGQWFGSGGRSQLGAYVKSVGSGFVSDAERTGIALHRFGFKGRTDAAHWGVFGTRFDREVQSGVAGVGSSTRDLFGVQWRRDGRRAGAATEFEHRGGAGTTASQLGAMRLWWRPVEPVRATLERQQTLSGGSLDRTALGLEWRVLGPLALEVRGSDGVGGAALRGGATVDVGGRQLYLRNEQRWATGNPWRSRLLGMQVPLGPMRRAYSEYQWQHDAAGERTASVLGLEQGWVHATGLQLRLSGEHAARGGSDGTPAHSTIASDLRYEGDLPIAVSTRGEYRTGGATGLERQFISSTHVEIRLPTGFALQGDYRLGDARPRAGAMVRPRFEESSVGLAYRPPSSDRLEALARWTSLDDRRAGGGSAGVADTLLRQTGLDVAALEATVRVTPTLEWAAKGALRRSRDGQFGAAPTAAHSTLWVSRVNYLLSPPLRLGVQYHTLAQREVGDRRGGWLQELSWEPVRHMTLGVGYNFSSFSGSEFDQGDGNAHGWFIRTQSRY